jgi:hypothetical protein
MMLIAMIIEVFMAENMGEEGTSGRRPPVVGKTIVAPQRRCALTGHSANKAFFCGKGPVRDGAPARRSKRPRGAVGKRAESFLPKAFRGHLPVPDRGHPIQFILR